ncbi:hypothetical protein [Rhodopirellula baltica]|nr:hypothetical protein [Rhodopirellula baltica]
MALTFGIFPGFALGLVGGWLGGFVSPDAATWARYIGWLVGIIGLTYGIVWYWPNERRRRQQADADSTDTVVEELTVNSSRVIELFCLGSHEPCLVFDLGGNQLLFLHGQWIRWESTYGAPDIVDDGNDDYLNLLDPPYSFPSDSFVVTRLPNSGHVFGISVTGDYLAVDDPIDALKPEYDFNYCEIIPGTIDSIPDSLRAEHQRRRGT